MEQEKVTEIVTIWYIRNLEDRAWQSVMFKSEEEAQNAIDSYETMENHEPYSVQFPVRYIPKQMDYRARHWVAENFENFSISHWSTEDCWQFIEEEHFGGRGGFLVMSSLDQTTTR